MEFSSLFSLKANNMKRAKSQLRLGASATSYSCQEKKKNKNGARVIKHS